MKCLYCSNIFSVSTKSPKQKFCSRSCSAKYSNSHRPAQVYEKSRSTLKKTLAEKPKGVRKEHFRNQYELAPSSCSVCGNAKPFTKRRDKTCSEQCRKELLSTIARKPNKRPVKRSKDEILLHQLCSKLPYVLANNHVIADGWDADIAFLDLKIAVFWNGPWHYKEMFIGTHSLAQVQNRDRIKTKLFESLGWSVLVFEDRTHNPDSAFNAIKDFIGTGTGGRTQLSAL